MDVVVNVKECCSKNLFAVMEDLEILAGRKEISTLQVNVEFIADYPLGDS